MLISAVPFIDSYFGSVVGVLIGLPPAVAIGVAVIGNVLSMLGFVFAASGVRSKVVAGKAAAAGAGSASSADASATDGVPSPRREKVRRAFDKYGVAGVSLLGPFVLPSQFTSAAMVSFGANRNAVIAWQMVSIVIWGVVAGVAVSLGVALVK
ncbi:hypothetical protein [Agromyces sp. S2-1-8]|uniref:hypothetical protein n=1 Tax=Agromyces sp. S2-1-8 TaxID=2897180 RepID=UPI0027DF5DD6|nr:hypothetical protein [Agromyces sp. S2-1-8]